MGVPAFFRWITKKYAAILERCAEAGSVEFEPSQIHVKLHPKDGGSEDDFDVEIESFKHEYDNFYIDMNGIIHNVSHGNTVEAGRDEEAVRRALFQKLDFLINLVKPKEVLLFAIDGVAPRAKMNQQRSRRFKSSKDSKDELEALKQKWAEEHPGGEPFPEMKPWDSNQISPGTEFMKRMSEAVQEYISQRLETDPLWKNLKVIFSDASVPGEGEHKILDFIRFNRQSDSYNAFTRHCFYGADADLLFLGLSLHEPFFTVLREDSSAAWYRWREGISATPTNCVFIGKIPTHITEKQILQVCSKFGEVDLGVLARDNRTGTSRGFAFVRFKSVADAAKLALGTVRLNKEKLLFTKFEKPEEVEKQISRNVPFEPLKDTLYVANLPFSVTETALGEAMQAYGRVLEVRIISDRNGRSKGYGYVQFETPDQAEAALYSNLVLGERALKLEIAGKKSIETATGLASTEGDSEDLTNLNPAEPVDVVANPDAKFVLLAKFLAQSGRFENNIAYRFLAHHNWCLNDAVASFLKGDPIPEIVRHVPGVAAPASPAVAPSSEVPSTAETDANTEEIEEPAEADAGDKPQMHVYVHIHILREYLQHEFEHAFEPTQTPFELERIIDDFVLICMMCGNDFLPHIPMLDIRKGAIDLLLHVYKLVFPRLGGYLVEPGRIHFDRLAILLTELSRLETFFMVRRFAADDDRKKRAETKALASSGGSQSSDPASSTGESQSSRAVADMYAPLIPTSESALWKLRYYKESFGISVLDPQFVEEVSSHFVEGLFWVYTYYYYGVDNSSWSWYYPYHFSPLLCDVMHVLNSKYKGQSSIPLELGKPLRPIEQLLAVLPPASAAVLPRAFQPLVLSPESPLKKYYPIDFEVYLEPGRPVWTGLALLNFIDIKQLLGSASAAEGGLTEEEKIRNTNRDAPVLAVRKETDFAQRFLAKDTNGTVLIRGENTPFTADLVVSDVRTAFQLLASEHVALAYCRSVSGSSAPLRVGRLLKVKSSATKLLLTTDELSRCLPKSKRYSYILGDHHHQHHQHPQQQQHGSESAVSPIEANFELTHCECFNDKKEHPWKHAFASLRPAASESTSDSLWLESDADEQLLVNLEFKTPTKLTSIAFTAPEAKIQQAPSHIKLLVNKLNIGFDNVEDMSADQEITLSETAVKSGAKIALNATKFAAVRTISIFISANLGGSASTVVSLVSFEGQVASGLDAAQLAAQQKH